MKTEKKYSYPKWMEYKNLKIKKEVHEDLSKFSIEKNRVPMYIIAELAIREYIRKNK